MKKRAFAITLILLFVPLTGCTAMDEYRQDQEKDSDDSRPEISGKVNLLEARVNSNTGGGGIVDSILILAKVAAGSTGVVVSDVSYRVSCEGDNGTVEAVIGTLSSENNSENSSNESLATQIGGSPMDDSNLTTGETFQFVIQLAQCSASVGDRVDLTILVDGGGTTIAELEVDGTEVGKVLD